MRVRSLAVLVLAVAGTIGVIYGVLFDYSLVLGVGAIALAGAAALSFLNTRTSPPR